MATSSGQVAADAKKVLKFRTFPPCHCFDFIPKNVFSCAVLAVPRISGRSHALAISVFPSP